MTKKISLLVLFSLLFLIPSQVFAQEENEEFNADKDISMYQHFSIEDKKNRIVEIQEITNEQHRLMFEVGKSTDIKIKHIIESGSWQNNNPKKIKIFSENYSNLKVYDDEGDSYPHSWEDETFEKSQYVVLQSKLPQYDLIVEYEIKEFLGLDNRIWKKQLSSERDVEIVFSDEIETVFVNSRPIDISVADGINCVSCNALIEFFDEALHGEINLENDSKKIDVYSDGKISDYKFTPKFNNLPPELNFKIEKNNQLIVLEIPLDLMLYPFEVYSTDNDDTVLDQIDKIRKTEFAYNEDYVKLSFRTQNIGNVWVIGATQEQHDIASAAITKQMVTESTVKEDSKNEPVENKLEQTELYENWGEPNQENEDSNTIIYVIVGIVIVGIIGAIIKLKKS